MQPITSSTSIEQTRQHIHIAFSIPHRITSSAVLNGGIIHADHLVNLNVPKHNQCTEPPEETLAQYCIASGWKGTAVGMMTAASMDSFRMAKETVQDIDVVVMVTAGLSNARRIGDHAEHRFMVASPESPGTINIVVLTSAALTEAAGIEAVLMVTEAKSAALQNAGIKSAVSDGIATGTGTDSVAIVSGHGPETVRYCGKHVLFGEILGRMVTDTVAASIEWEFSDANSEPTSDEHHLRK
ncbi:adenosylcobinamide amidohydrolase [uncultured Desulfuromusa sp.]|uniref:adenosylcobinamide amidohydrolase n=1 Tax=uncultured Desulfuromusa sp. TaxID=219183 RepID=UPI002AA79512|nr:adenosylcobinamide amidohydrolase [uncultured Desulfuromusa sp.]